AERHGQAPGAQRGKSRPGQAGEAGTRGADRGAHRSPQVHRGELAVPHVRALDREGARMTRSRMQRSIDQVVGATPASLLRVLPHPLAYEGIPVTQISERDSVEPILAHARAFAPDIMHIHYWGDCDTPWYTQAFECAKLLGCRVVENVNTPVDPYLAPEVREY